MSRQRPQQVVAAFGLLALVVAFAGACEARFPACKSNDECKARWEGNEDKSGPPTLVCYDLRCVECRYDSDCSEGYACSRVGTCQALDITSEPRPGASASASAAPPSTP